MPEIGVCLKCGRDFVRGQYGHNGHKYCRPECRPSYVPAAGPFREERKCAECDDSYIARAPTQKWCSTECRKNGRGKYQYRYQKQYNANKQCCQTEKELLRTKLWQMPRDLRLRNEEEFADWFAGHHLLFGISEIIRLDTAFPDVIATLFSGKTISIELEYWAGNFKNHKHNPLECDLIIAYAKSPFRKEVCGVPVIALFEGPKESFRQRQYRDAMPTDYFDRIMERAGAMVEETLPAYSAKVIELP